jgi:hypothetical protein
MHLNFPINMSVEDIKSGALDDLEVGLGDPEHFPDYDPNDAVELAAQVKQTVKDLVDLGVFSKEYVAGSVTGRLGADDGSGASVSISLTAVDELPI